MLRLEKRPLTDARGPVTRRCALGTLAAGALAAQDILRSPPPKADARIPYGRDSQQFGDFRIPPGRGPHPLLIFIHGGFWKAQYNLLHTGHLCAALKSAGVATWNLEYRRIGDPGGGWPGTLEDIVHGAEHVRYLANRYPLNLDHLLAAGHSAGGQLALWLAAQMAVDLRGVISLAGVADLRRAWALRLSDGIVAKFLGGTPDQVPSRYAAASPIELVPIAVKQDVIHGTDDDIVPFEISQRFAKASHNSRLIPIKGAGHFGLIDPKTPAWKIVQARVVGWT